MKPQIIKHPHFPLNKNQRELLDSIAISYEKKDSFIIKASRAVGVSSALLHFALNYDYNYPLDKMANVKRMLIVTPNAAFTKISQFSNTTVKWCNILASSTLRGHRFECVIIDYPQLKPDNISNFIDVNLPAFVGTKMIVAHNSIRPHQICGETSKVIYVK